MALPSSGPLSIDDIRTELGSSSGSLRTLSAAAGKSTPDAISEFYGYSSFTPDDGKYVVTVGYYGNWLSTDYGLTYASINVGSTNTMGACAISGDGQIIGVCDISVGTGRLSTNGGSTWGVYPTIASANYRAMAFSENGEYQVIGGQNRIYVLSNYGSTQVYNSAIRCEAVAISTTGQYIAFGQYSGRIYLSTNYGSTFTDISSNAPGGMASANWDCLVMSNDGQFILAVPLQSGYHIRTTNAGATWDNPLGILPNTQHEMAGTGDGQYIIYGDPNTGTSGERIFYSSNYGVSFNSVRPFPGFGGHSVASSYSGNVMVARFFKNYDAGKIAVSNNFGASWTQVKTFSGTNIPASNDVIAISRSTQ